MKEDVANRIVEEKSINSDIVNLSDLIADKILKQAIFDRIMNESKSKYGKIVYGIEKIYLVE